VNTGNGAKTGAAEMDGQSKPANLDEMCMEKLINAPWATVAWYLGASYLYYIRDVSLLSDTMYDKLARTMLRSWESIQHPHKYLITQADLRAGTLYRLAAHEYPTITKSAACRHAREYLGLDTPFRYGVH
jgi:hypothetical protein